MRWATVLLRDTSSILLDSSIDGQTTSAIKQAIESAGENRVSDLHVWTVGPDRWAAIISVVTPCPERPDHYKNLLSPFEGLVHVTIEVIPCPSGPGRANIGDV
jgi:Co/Zn/Cd efflux system component